MDDSDDGGIFSLQAHVMCVWKYEHVHLGMLYSKVGTDDIDLNILVLKLMEDFTIQDKFIAYTSNGGYNLKTFQDALEGKVTNAAIYRTQQTMFRRKKIAYALQGACKAAVIYFNSNDDKGAIILCVATLQTQILLSGQRRVHLVKELNLFSIRHCSALINTPIVF